MADSKLSALTAGATLADTDEVYINDGGVSKRMTGAALRTAVVTGDAQAAGIVASDAKATPVNADSLGIVDSEAANVGKEVTFSQLKAFLKTYFDTLYDITAAGSMKIWGNATPDTGWLSCDGSAVNRTTYSALFTAIGTSFGVGDGSTTFNLPDLDGRSPVGVGTGDASDATAWTLGEKGGTEKHTLITSEIPAHTHDINGPVQLEFGSTYGRGGDSAGATSASTGGGGAHQNMSPVLGVYFNIKT